MPKLVFTVTNDLVFDQRMNRICNSLANEGYEVLLIGRKSKNSPPLQLKNFQQKRIKCFAEKGKLMYIEFNIKLFLVLLFTKGDLFCAIDLDSILPIYFASVLKNKKRVYDAHELFCEMEEIYSRPLIYKIWKNIEKFAVPKFEFGYTIGDYYAHEFNKLYNRNYEVIRNATVLNEKNILSNKNEVSYILYQGAVNVGRSFETLIPAMQFINTKLIICGKGNYYDECIALINQFLLQNKIEMKGYLKKEELIKYTKNAYIGITIFSNEQKSKSNYLSLGNRFFDYMHSAVPQICVNYPEYQKINNEFEIALLIDDLRVNTISNAINKLINNKPYYEKLRANAIECSKKYCWQNEEKKLIQFYKNIFEK